MNTSTADLPIGTLVKYPTGDCVWSVEDTSAEPIYDGLSFEFVSLRATYPSADGYKVGRYSKRRHVYREKIARLVIVKEGE